MLSRFPAPVKKPRTRGDIKGVSSYRRHVGHVSGQYTTAVGVASTTRSSSSSDSPYYMIGLALVKYILKKEFGVDVINTGSTLYTLVPPIYHTQNNVVNDKPRWSTLALYGRKTNDYSSAIVSFWSTNTTSTTTVTSMAADIGLALKDFVSARYEQTANTVDPYSWRNGYRFFGYSVGELQSMGSTNNDATIRSTTGVRRVEDMIMSFSVKTLVKIQNTTVGMNINSLGQPTLSSGDADRIEEPLRGKMFHFSDPVAIVRGGYDRAQVTTVSHAVVPVPPDSTLDTFGAEVHKIGWDTNEDGIIKPTQAGADALAMRFIPRPEYWQNCRGYSNIYLRPGEVKSHVMNFKFDGYINKLLEGFALDKQDYYGENRQQDHLGFGVMDLFCFEEDVKSDVTDFGLTSVNPPVAIGFSVERWTRCAVKKNIKRGTLMERNFSTPQTVVPADYTLTIAT